jgi:hypothetical protein
MWEKERWHECRQKKKNRERIADQMYQQDPQKKPALCRMAFRGIRLHEKEVDDDKLNYNRRAEGGWDAYDAILVVHTYHIGET